MTLVVDGEGTSADHEREQLVNFMGDISVDPDEDQGEDDASASEDDD